MKDVLSLREVTQALALTPICEPEDFDRDRKIARIYAGDLLSRAMSHVGCDDLWITIMNNRNVIAVASLADAAAILLAEGVELLPDALEAARQNGIAVYSSPLPVYEICRAIAGISV